MIDNLKYRIGELEANMNRAVGIDVSKYQMSFDPDHAVNQIDYVLQRTSWGMNKDELYSVIWQGVRKIERRGAYHYFSTGSPWQDQADLFLEIGVGKQYKMLLVDYEHGYNNLNARTARNLLYFLQYLIEQRPGKRIVGYSNTYTYRDFIQPYVDLSEISWMFARYPLFPRPQTAGPRFPRGCRTAWNWHQYSQTGRGGLYGCGWKYVDLGVFNGTVADLDTFLKMNAFTPPPPVIDVRAETIQECITALKEL